MLKMYLDATFLTIKILIVLSIQIKARNIIKISTNSQIME